MVATARRMLAALFWLESAIAVAALLAVAAILFADVVGRELFGQGLFGALRAAVYATAIAGLIGFGLCTAAGAHMRVNLLDKLLPARLEPSIERIADGLSFVICAAFAYWSVLYVLQTYAQNEQALSLGVPVWPFQVVLPWMFISAGIRYLIFALLPVLRPVEQEPTP
ncbi:TRAP transporter small permease [Phreatobacter stygius]|uniref:TRAP transporter small permease protein n=1 Tax=Phreatobacter stygius TaxID=1940610 RepID=A0A4D7B5G9_9HYPH|nr:TRAP transporter small permease [Phreatobacter stygius]QCI65350.1 TRAP transporter small permease [Phreatobacter stygius]